MSWPGRRELTGTTMVVIVAVFFFGFFLYVVDMIVEFGMTYLYRLAGAIAGKTGSWTGTKSGTSSTPTPDTSARLRRA